MSCRSVTPAEPVGYRTVSAVMISTRRILPDLSRNQRTLLELQKRAVVLTVVVLMMALRVLQMVLVR